MVRRNARGLQLGSPRVIRNEAEPEDQKPAYRVDGRSRKWCVESAAQAWRAGHDRVEGAALKPANLARSSHTVERVVVATAAGRSELMR